MAELIPISYRLRAAQKQQVRRWIFGGSLAVGVAAASVLLMFLWAQRQASERRLQAAEYQKRTTAIADSRRVMAARDQLAQRMQTVQQLVDDRMLLTVLQGICEGFSSSDTLEYLAVDARGPGKDVAKERPRDDVYVVRITGMTANNATLADLVTRLSRQSSLGMTVVLESSRREPLYDGQVVHFELRCEKSLAKGT